MCMMSDGQISTQCPSRRSASYKRRSAWCVVFPVAKVDAVPINNVGTSRPLLALDKLGPELVLQLADLHRQCRLADRTFLGGTPEMAVTGVLQVYRAISPP